MGSRRSLIGVTAALVLMVGAFSGCQDIDEFGPGKLSIAYLPSASLQYSGLGALAEVREAFDKRQLSGCQGMKVTGLGWSCPGGNSARWSATPVASIIQNGDHYSICLRAYASESCRDSIWTSLCNATSRNGCEYTDPAGAPAARRAVDGVIILALARKALAPEQDKAFIAAASAALSAEDVEAKLFAAVENRRRLQVQVDALLANQRTFDAARAYAEYLATDPLWAQGHYNNAVVLAGLELYPDAIAAAQKNIYLEPQGAYARNAKDQVYTWEALLAAPTK